LVERVQGKNRAALRRLRRGVAVVFLALALSATLASAKSSPKASGGGSLRAARTKTLPPTTASASRLEAAVAAARRVARDVGVNIIDVDTGATVYALDPDRPRVVASNTKLFTTAATLDALGPGYLLETRVLANGSVVNGELQGDLAVVGGGDPNISGRQFGGDEYAVFRRWAADLHRRGITRVRGGLFLVSGFFDGQEIHPDWPRDQRERWYEAPVADLSFNDNTITVRVVPGAGVGAPANVVLEPPVDLYRISNNAVTVGSPRQQAVYVGRSADGQEIQVGGRVALRSAGEEAVLTVPDPVAFFGAALRDALREEGIKIEGTTERVWRVPPGGWEEVTEHASDLQSSIETTNKLSQNFYAESLFKLLGRVRCGEGSWQAGARAMREFLARVGIPAGTYSQVDGSGMSRNDRYAPSQITRLLRYMYQSPHGREFMRSLAYSGEDGLSWRHRLASRPYAGNVLAKTGTLDGVSSLSGYARARSGKLYAFSILCNGVRGWAHGAQDSIVRALIDNH